MATNDELITTYEDYDIHITREDTGSFYIHVQNPNISFGTTYDGYWGDEYNTIQEAFEEALKGSQLIQKDS